MRASAYHVIVLLLSAYTSVQGSPISDDLIFKRDSLQQEAVGDELTQRDVDQRVVSTVERALDTLNEFFEKRHPHHHKSITTQSKNRRRSWIGDVWNRIKTGANDLWKNNKQEIVKTGLAILLGKRGDDGNGELRRSDLGHQSEEEGLKRESGKYRAFLTLVRRGWFSDAWETVKNTASNVADTIKKGYNKLKDTIEDTVDDAKEKWEKFKDLVGREASASSSVKFSNIVNFLDRRDVSDRNGYHDEERRSYAEDELERRDERTDVSSDVHRAVEALRDLQDFLDLASAFAAS